MAQISHREQLIKGAIACLQTKGYARTTARDIAAAADANLASIGYHFGSKDALLNEALIETFMEWTRRIGEISFAAEQASPLERLTTSWVAMLEGFEEHRPVLVAFVEAMAQVERSDELRRQLAAHYRDVRAAVAEMVRAALGPDAERMHGDLEAVASFLIALCDGFVLQWLLDPDDTPSGEELVAALGEALGLALERDAAASAGAG